MFSHAYVCVRVNVSGGVLKWSSDTGHQQRFRLQMSLPLHIVLKPLSTGSPSFHRALRSLHLALCFSRSVSVSFTCSPLHDHFSPPQSREIWASSYILGRRRLLLCVFGGYGSSLHVSPFFLQACVSCVYCMCVCGRQQ